VSETVEAPHNADPAPTPYERTVTLATSDEGFRGTPEAIHRAIIEVYHAEVRALQTQLGLNPTDISTTLHASVVLGERSRTISPRNTLSLFTALDDVAEGGAELLSEGLVDSFAITIYDSATNQRLGTLRLTYEVQ